MSHPENGPPQGVPRLTEVVDWPKEAAPGAPTQTAETAPIDPEGAAAEATSEAISAPIPAVRLPDESELTARVLEQVQRQIDLMIEYRMREALTPLLARATDALVRDARTELASTLREVVGRAVAQELARHRNR